MVGDKSTACLTIFYQYTNLFLEAAIKCPPLNITIKMHMFPCKVVAAVGDAVQHGHNRIESLGKMQIRRTFNDLSNRIYTGMNTQSYLPRFIYKIIVEYYVFCTISFYN